MTNNINPNMSNFEVAEARKQGTSFDTFKETNGWSSDEVKKRIITARSGIEWQYGEGPNAIKEIEEREVRRFEAIKNEYSEVRSGLLKIIHNKTVDVYYKYLDDKYQNWYDDLPNLDKNELGVTFIKDIMKSMNITYYDSNESGIQFILPDGRKGIVHTLGTDVSGFVIHDIIDKLKGDVFVYINNMKYRSHKVYIMTKDQIVSGCVDRGDEADPQKMIPLRALKDHENMFDTLRYNRGI